MATAAEARAARFEAASRRRLDEARDAWDFLYHGEAHVDRCIFRERGLPACSRDYNPGPAPEDEKLYEGTGIGALFGGAPEITYTDSTEQEPHRAVTRSHLAQLAGWNIVRGARS